MALFGAKAKRMDTKLSCLMMSIPLAAVLASPRTSVPASSQRSRCHQQALLVFIDSTFVIAKTPEERGRPNANVHRKIQNRTDVKESMTQLGSAPSFTSRFASFLLQGLLDTLANLLFASHRCALVAPNHRNEFMVPLSAITRRIVSE